MNISEVIHPFGDVVNFDPSSNFILHRTQTGISAVQFDESTW
jgi:hypothetical protein